MNEAKPKFTGSALRGRQEGPRGSALNFDSRLCRPLRGAPLGSSLRPPTPGSPLARSRRMQISPWLAGGLLLALLSVRLEAKPASQLPQKVRLGLPPGSPSPPRPAEGPKGTERDKRGDFAAAESVQSGVLLPHACLSAGGPAASPACPKRARPGDASSSAGAAGGRRAPRTPRGRGRGGRKAASPHGVPPARPLCAGTGEGEQSRGAVGSRCTAGREPGQPSRQPCRNRAGCPPGKGRPEWGCPRELGASPASRC